jgi:hypothetical protein
MKKAEHNVRCLCGTRVTTKGGSSYYFDPNGGQKVGMYSCSVRCPNLDCQLQIPRGRWFPSHQEAKEDALKRWECAIHPMKIVSA